MILRFRNVIFLVLTFSFRLLGMEEESIVHDLCRAGNHKALKIFCDSYTNSYTRYNDFKKIHRILNFQDGNGNTPLHMATKKSFPECVNLLLNQNHIDCNIKNNKGIAPFIYAIIDGNCEIIDCFLSRYDLNVNTTAPGDLFDFDVNDKISPLCFACDTANKNLISKLLEHNKIDLSLECSGEKFFQRIIEVANIDLIKFIMTNERSERYLKSETSFLIRSLISLENSDLLDEEIKRTFEIIVNFCSDKQINARYGDYGQGIIHYILKSNFNGLKKELVDIVLKGKNLDIKLEDGRGFTPLDDSFYFNEPEVLKKLFQVYLGEDDALWNLSSHIFYRSSCRVYQEHAFEQKNCSFFFSSLFNSLCKLGSVDALNMDVSFYECSQCRHPLREAGNDGEHSLVVKIECGHLFGLTCLSKRMKNCTTCPVCEKNIFSPTLFDYCEVRFPISNHK